MSDLVLITGGAGMLGQVLAPLLVDAGYRVRSADVRPIEDAPEDVEFVEADIRDRAAVEKLVARVRAIVHTAAWHGIHLREHPAQDFWDLNATGSFHVYDAAADAGVEAIVFSSTMGVYGSSRKPAEGGGAVFVNEQLPLVPEDIYGLSKVLGEQIACDHATRRGIAGAALRYGMFVPEPFLREGIRFLYGGVDERDVATAVMLVLERLLAERRWIGEFNIESPLPFSPDDARGLRDDPIQVIRKHWPDASELLESAGAELWGPIEVVYEIDRARRELGWQPRYGFDSFLTALRTGATASDRGV
ncbi:MAG: NAD-dependent epimerase/dehydratase family protein [Chloroflexota bacterium]